MNGVVSYAVIRADSSVVFFFIGDFLYGCCGSLPTMTMSCYAYIAQRTPKEKRMLRITLLQLCLLVTGMITAIVIGPLMFEVGKDNTIMITFFIGVANFAYVFLFLRNDDRKIDKEQIMTEDQPDAGGLLPAQNEDGGDLVSRSMQSVTEMDTPGNRFETIASADDEHLSGLPRFRHVARRSRDNDDDDVDAVDPPPPPPPPEREKSRIELQTRQLCSGIVRVGSLFLYPGPHRFRLNVLLATFFCSVLPTFDGSLENLFEMNQPLCWRVRDIGVFTGTTLAISASGALVVMPLMKKCATDWHIAVTASVAAIITNVYKFFVRNTLMMYLCKFVFLFVMLSDMFLVLSTALALFTPTI